MHNVFLKGQRGTKILPGYSENRKDITEEVLFEQVSWRININLPGREEENNVPDRCCLLVS